MVCSIIVILILALLIVIGELIFCKKRHKNNNNIYEAKRQTQQLFETLQKNHFKIQIKSERKDKQIMPKM